MPQVPDPIRIALIDDHALVRGGIARLLAAQPDFEVVAEAATIEEGLEVVKTKPVDIVLLDINLGTQQGGAFLTLARAQGYAGKVLVVTAGISKLETSRLLQRGCAGVFLKHERPPVLIEKIRAIVSAAEGDLPLDGRGGAEVVQDGQDTPPLTPRERQVLRRVFAGETNKAIAFELGISEPLVKAFVQQLFTKTGVRSRSQLVRVAVERYWKELEES